MALLEVTDLHIRYEPRRSAPVDAVTDITFAIDKHFGIKMPLEKWMEDVNEGRAAAEQARAEMVSDFEASEGAAL